MATWDFGGGCPCGVSKICDCMRSWSQEKKDNYRLKELEIEINSLKKRLKDK